MQIKILVLYTFKNETQLKAKIIIQASLNIWIDSLRMAPFAF